jgi:hypothetical protein
MINQDTINPNAMNTVIVGLDLTQLQAFMTDMSDITAEKVAVKLGKKPATMSFNAACKRFRRTVVERWIREGVIKRYSDGPGLMCRINEAECMIAEASENRIAHLTSNGLMYDQR